MVNTDFSSASNPFTSTVPGCETGTVQNGSGGPHFTPKGGTFVGTKVFTCDSGAGTLTLSLNARFSGFGSTGHWILSDTSGVYSGLKGAGSLVGVPTAVGIDDYYTGSVRI